MDDASRARLVPVSNAGWITRLRVFALVAGALLVLVVGAVYRSAPPANRADARADEGKPSVELSDRLKACVFPVRASTPDEADPKRVRVEYGSGVAVGPKGTFLTAAHVIRSNRKDARIVVLVGDRELVATVARVGAGLDAAVLSVPDYDGSVLDLGGTTPKAEARVFAAGYPVKFSGAALPRLIVTAGRVDDPAAPSPLKELHKGDVIRVAGATDPGGSGGALVAPDGALLGIVFGSRVVENSATHLYAVPAAELKTLLADAR